MLALSIISFCLFDTITFYFDQSLFEENLPLDEYIKNIEEVSKEQVIDIAQKVSINTIYYLEK